eukprot:3546036-Amphidinium_carterae.1
MQCASCTATGGHITHEMTSKTNLDAEMKAEICPRRAMLDDHVTTPTETGLHMGTRLRTMLVKLCFRASSMDFLL